MKNVYLNVRTNVKAGKNTPDPNYIRRRLASAGSPFQSVR